MLRLYNTEINHVRHPFQAVFNMDYHHTQTNVIQRTTLQHNNIASGNFIVYIHISSIGIDDVTEKHKN
jgi:hypothetical protein